MDWLKHAKAARAEGLGLRESLKEGSILCIVLAVETILVNVANLNTLNGLQTPVIAEPRVYRHRFAIAAFLAA